MNIGNGQLLGKRESQQDYFASLELNDHIVLVLTDGIGGLVGGHVASEVAVKAFLAKIRKMPLSDPEAALMASVHSANQAIADVGKNNGSVRGMGTTLVALLIGSEKITWLSVGDSLLYLWRNRSLSRLNRVHTRMVELEEQVYAGALTQAQAELDPQRDSITSALRGEDIPHIDCQSRARSSEEGFLIASDGLSTLRISQMQLALRESDDAQRNVDKLMQLVEKADDQMQDNCTVLFFLPERKNAPAESRKIHKWATIASIVALLLLSVVVLWPLFEESDEPVPESSAPATDTESTVDPLEPAEGDLSTESTAQGGDGSSEQSVGGKSTQSETTFETDATDQADKESIVTDTVDSDTPAQPDVESPGNQNNSVTPQSGTDPNVEEQAVVAPEPDREPQNEQPLEQEQVPDTQQGLSKDRL